MIDDLSGKGIQIVQTLSSFVGRYARDHEIAAVTIRSYATSATRYENWVRNNLEYLAQLEELRTLNLDQFSGEDLPIEVTLNSCVLNSFLVSLDEPSRSKHTIARYRREILVLWRDAFDVGLIDAAPRRIRQVRTPETPKDVWTPEEVLNLVAACSDVQRGRFRRTRIWRAAFFESLIRAGWDSSLRLGDLLRFPVADLADNGDVRRQNKTGEFVDVVFQTETLLAIETTFDKFTPRRTLVWPLWARREEFYKQFRRIVAAAGLTGTFKKIRRSGITDVERHGGQGHLQAGHTSPATTARWYLNKALAHQHRTRPTSLRSIERRQGA